MRLNNEFEPIRDSGDTYKSVIWFPYYSLATREEDNNYYFKLKTSYSWLIVAWLYTHTHLTGALATEDESDPWHGYNDTSGAKFIQMPCADVVWQRANDYLIEQGELPLDPSRIHNFNNYNI